MILLEQKILNLTSSNIPEHIPEFVLGNNYSLGTETRYIGYIYKAAKNITNADIVPSKDTKSWVKMRPSNTYSLIDNDAFTVTKSNGDIVVEFVNNRYSHLFMAGLKGDNVKIEIIEAGSVIKTYDSSLEEVIITQPNWFNYYYGAFPESRSDNIITQELLVSFGTIRVTISGTETACAFMVGGVGLDVGCILEDMKVSKYKSFLNDTPKTEIEVTSVISKNVFELLRLKIDDLLYKNVAIDFKIRGVATLLQFKEYNYSITNFNEIEVTFTFVTDIDT